MFDIIVIFIVILCVFVSFMRGALKELFGLMGLFLSVTLTINHYNFFNTNYMKYIESEVIVSILSTISVFIIITTIIIIVNNWIMYVLSPIRLGVVDRFSGIFFGVLKGILFSSVLFLIVEIYYFTFYYKSSTDSNQQEETLPEWLIDSHSYPLFHAMENKLNQYIPQSLHEKVREFGNNLKDMVNKKAEDKEEEHNEKPKDKNNKQQHKHKKVNKNLSS